MSRGGTAASPESTGTGFAAAERSPRQRRFPLVLQQDGRLSRALVSEAARQPRLLFLLSP